MALGTEVVVRAAQAWLESSWHVQVPFAWLEACVEWLQEDAGGATRLSQQQINQQALDQWLMTDLRDLNHPVLPEGLARAQKTKLNGTFCVQVDSSLDISQPAYGQLQKCRGTDCTNEEVSAVTQTTQKPWETKAARVLLLQVTDGVQSLEAMEYQTIPALNAPLRPGAKLQLHGQMVCRLGVLLLEPINVKVLGGEVEDLVDRNSQARVLCRQLGLPEEEEGQQQQQQQEAMEPQQNNQEMESLEVDDAELLASLEAQGDEEVHQVGFPPDSGYNTLQETSASSSISSSVSSHVSSRSETSHRGGLIQTNRSNPVPVHYRENQLGESDRARLALPNEFQQNFQENNASHFPDEDFDDLPLEELDSIGFRESENSTRNAHEHHNRVSASAEAQTARLEASTLTNSGLNPGLRNSRPTAQQSDGAGCSFTKSLFPLPALERPHGSTSAWNDEKTFVDEAMNGLFQEVDPNAGHLKTIEINSEEVPPPARGVCDVSLTSPPFTYLCLLEEFMSKPDFRATQIQVKAFIVTLLGKLSSSNGAWSVCATICDGSGYLEAELSDEVLTGLLGFSVAEKALMRRDASRRGELEAGMRRCQEELVDMCCIMTVAAAPGSKARVTKVEPVSESVLRELEQRVRERKK